MEPPLTLDTAALVLAGGVSLSVLAYLLPILLVSVLPAMPLRQRYPDAEWALVTGAASGVGKALAHTLASEGINVVLVAIEASELEAVFEELRAAHPRRDFRKVTCDLSSNDGVDMVYVEAATSDINVALIFCAANYQVTGFFHAIPLNVHLAGFQANSASAVRIAHHFLHKLYSSKSVGLLVFFSSPSAELPSPFAALSSATLAFNARLAASLAAEAGPQGIDVLAAYPSLDTRPEDVPQQLLRRIGRSQIIADLGPGAALGRLLGKVLDANALAVAYASIASSLPEYKRGALLAGLSPRSLRRDSGMTLLVLGVLLSAGVAGFYSGAVEARV